jgi:hypothetical protein
MEQIVIKYLEKQYMFTLSTIQSYVLTDRVTGEQIYLKALFNTLSKIFGISDSELLDIWDVWADKKIKELNNRIVDIRYKIYEITGVDDESNSIREINEYLFNLESGKE